MKAKLIRDLKAAPSAEQDTRMEERDGVRWWPEGTVLEDARAFRLVQQGVAEPADEECEEAAAMTPAMMAAAQAAQDRIHIHPDDFEAFEAGKMIGYDEDGEWIPGPNFEEGDDEDE